MQLIALTIYKEGKTGYLTMFPFFSSIYIVFTFDENRC